MPAHAPPSSAWAMPTASDGNRRPLGYRVPSRRAIRGPIMPMRSSDFAVSTSAAIEPRVSWVSGLATRIHSALVAAAPWLIAAANPTLRALRMTRPPNSSRMSALRSTETLSIPITSTAYGATADGSVFRNPGRSSALW